MSLLRLPDWKTSPVTFGLLRFFASIAPAFALLAMAGLNELTEPRRRYVWVSLGLTLVGALVLWRRAIHDDTTFRSGWDLLPPATLLTWSLLYVAPRRSRLAAACLPILFGAFFLVRSHQATLRGIRYDK